TCNAVRWRLKRLIVFIVDFNVVLLDLDDGLTEEVICLPDEPGGDIFNAIRFCDSLAKTDKRLQLSYSNAVRHAAVAARIVLPKFLVLFYQELLRFLGEDRLERPGVAN